MMIIMKLWKQQYEFIIIITYNSLLRHIHMTSSLFRDNKEIFLLLFRDILKKGGNERILI